MDKGYFPYGNKSKEFLIKRTLYLCRLLKFYNCDEIILACNTLSKIVLPFVKQFYNVIGVFEELEGYINNNSVIIASNALIKELKYDYPNNLLIDGSNLIYLIENNLDTKIEVERINSLIKGKSNIIMACTHFLGLNSDFIIETIRNRNKFL